MMEDPTQEELESFLNRYRAFTNQLKEEELESFLNRYRAFTNQLKDLRLQRFQSDFSRLKTSVTSIKTEAEEQNRLLASSFNIFRLLGVTHKEVIVHSALIANLLNPKGTHAQKHLFLDNFLRMCARFDDFPLPTGDIASSRWVVEKEKVTPFGCMDLVISCPALRFLLVIENKIWASEQPDQLKRYYDWMESKKDRFANQALFYLTPGGDKPHTSADSHCFTLSYHDDISAWLDACLVHVKAPRVKETISQYLEIIKNL
jgi:hypothetical protein